MRRKQRIIHWGLLGIVVIAFALAGLDKLHEGDELSPYDTTAYLTDAREVRAWGGPLVLLRRYFDGTYRPANRMPLYIMMLSALPFGSLNVLAWAKLMTLFLGAIGLVVTFWAVRRIFNARAALLAAGLLAVNSAYLAYSTIVCCEPLLVIWVTAAWLCLVRYLRRGRGAGWLGAFLGLAYMTKGTALLLLPVAAGAFLWRDRSLKSRQMWLGIFAFILVSLPMSVRNLRCYGSPFYNTNTSFMWTHSTDELYSPDPAISAPTSRTYWRDHTIGQMANRFLRGGVQQGVFTAVACGQTYPLNERLGLKVWPVGVLVLFLAGAAVIRRRQRMVALTALAPFVIFTGFFAWYPAKDIRFIVPLLPMLLGLGAQSVDTGATWLYRRRLHRSRIVPRWCAVALTTALAVGTIGFALSRPNLRSSPLRCCRVPPGYYALLDWLREHVTREESCMLGPSHAYAYFWTAALDGKLVPVPWVPSMDRLQEIVREEKISHVVIDYSTLRNRERCFRGWVELDGDALRLKAVPPGWREAMSLGDPPSVIAFEALRIADPHDSTRGD